MRARGCRTAWNGPTRCATTWPSFANAPTRRQRLWSQTLRAARSEMKAVPGSALNGGGSGAASNAMREPRGAGAWSGSGGTGGVLGAPAAATPAAAARGKWWTRRSRGGTFARPGAGRARQGGQRPAGTAGFQSGRGRRGLDPGAARTGRSGGVIDRRARRSLVLSRARAFRGGAGTAARSAFGAVREPGPCNEMDHARTKRPVGGPHLQPAVADTASEGSKGERVAP